jgi:hypothetical protein
MTHSVLRGFIAGWLLTLSAFAKQDLSTLPGFEAAFRHANASKDFRQLEQLVYWQHAGPRACREMREVLRKEFGRPIDRIQVSPYSREAAIYPPQNPNLKPTHFFTVWSVGERDKIGQQTVGTFYTLGRRDGQFYFVVSDQWPVSSVHYTSADLTNRSSQPLAVVMTSFDFMKPFKEFAMLVAASGGSACSR